MKSHLTATRESLLRVLLQLRTLLKVEACGTPVLQKNLACMILRFNGLLRLSSPCGGSHSAHGTNDFLWFNIYAKILRTWAKQGSFPCNWENQLLWKQNVLNDGFQSLSGSNLCKVLASLLGFHNFLAPSIIYFSVIVPPPQILILW